MFIRKTLKKFGIRPSIDRPVWRLPRIRVPKARRYYAEGGPFSGQVLMLRDGTTTVFNIGGQCGRYECGFVATLSGSGMCKWRPFFGRTKS